MCFCLAQKLKMGRRNLKLLTYYDIIYIVTSSFSKMKGDKNMLYFYCYEGSYNGTTKRYSGVLVTGKRIETTEEFKQALSDIEKGIESRLEISFDSYNLIALNPL